MSQENVDVVREAVDAYNRRDLEALMEVHDPGVEWHPAIQALLGGEAAVYWGHEGVREFVRDLDSAFAELRIEISEIRDLGERVVAMGHLRGRGKESGAETESYIGYLVEFKNGKMARILSFLDPKATLEAAGLRE